MRTFLYFAYGSNLLEARLRERCPSARRVASATAPDHVAAFDVRAADGSAKMGLRVKRGAVAHGALWWIDATDRDGLARAEGVDYREVEAFVVRLPDGALSSVVTWLPRRGPEPSRPWHWYRALVLAGAVETALPPEVTSAFASAAFDRDPDPSRPAFLMARRALAEAGRLDLIEASPGP